MPSDTRIHLIYEAIPHPVLLNTWKHHAGWIRWRVAQAVSGGREAVEALPAEMVVVGSRLMDLYTGPLTPAEIALELGDQLRAGGRFEYAPLADWLRGQGEYVLLDLSDGSKWTIRLGPEDGRYIHLHPGRWVPNTMRVNANSAPSSKCSATGDPHAGSAPLIRRPPHLPLAYPSCMNFARRSTTGSKNSRR